MVVVVEKKPSYIFVLEDEYVVQEILRVLFSKMGDLDGFEIHMEASYQGAVEWVDSHRELVACALLDQCVPGSPVAGGFVSYVVGKGLIDPRQTIIMSGMGPVDHTRLAMAQGAVFLSKPFVPNEVKWLIKDRLSNGGG